MIRFRGPVRARQLTSRASEASPVVPALELARRTVVALAIASGVVGCHDEIAPLGPAQVADAPNALVVSTPHSFRWLATNVSGFVPCGIRSDGAVECWGAMRAYLAPVHVPTSGTFTQVVSVVSPLIYNVRNLDPYGNYFTYSTADRVKVCALRSDGVVKCWAYFDDPSFSEPEREHRASVGRFVQVEVAGYNDFGVCGLRSDGVVQCSGHPLNQNGTFIMDWGNAPPERAPSVPGEQFTQFSMSHDFTCGLRSDGVVECWGRNTGGAAPPERLAAPGRFYVQVTTGDSFTCGLRDDGAVECWGSSGSVVTERRPVDGRYIQVTAGGHACALRTDGVVECWGRNESGQAPAERATTNGRRFVQVMASGGSTCAVRDDGIVECWGYNADGQAPATKTASGSWTRREYPVATFGAPASVTVGASFDIGFKNAYVPGAPGETEFTYRLDCGDGAGYGAASKVNAISCPTSALGQRTVRGQVIDRAGDATEYTAQVSVQMQRQTVTLGYVAPRTVHPGETYLFTATASSGLPATVLITAASAPYCSISGSGATRPVTFLAEGECTVVAHQGGTELVEPAFPHSVAFTVVRRPQTITLGSLPGTVIVGARLVLTATGGGSGNPVTFTSLTPATCATSGPSGATLAITGPGWCRVQADQAGTPAYLPATPVLAELSAMTPEHATTMLHASVIEYGHQEIAAPLLAAVGALRRGSTAEACRQLDVFIRVVEARRTKFIRTSLADAWIAEATRIREALGC
ncbi:RCC1 domain-containing protein [Roseisolibacter agri]|uniref:non-specific serine/threonine protein kinase n=1 Tax=Roseisolibacter agri TaxID=2014610 RepID=A0AA37QG12_9BACT|nr:hypothetical protein [Roseisolibacter agri]GLC25103.1 hypothetical protein rosag_16160 [Roseisolibacter agri]